MGKRNGKPDGRGGAREGAGRKLGGINQGSRAVAKQTMKDAGLTPLEVMFANMVFWHKTSEHLAVKFQDLMSMADGSNSEGALEVLDKCNGLMEKFLEARENAQRCAVDAAPYCHPRLQAIKFEGKDETLLEVTMALAPPRDDQEEVRGYRDGYTSVVPLRRSAA